MPSLLIDSFLPEYEFSEFHRVRIRASPERVYTVAREVDCKRLPLTLFLFFLRGLPGRIFWPQRRRVRFEPNLVGLLRMGFLLLGELPDQEFVLGAVGRFWTAHGDIERISAREFCAFHEPGNAKMVWNFRVTRTSPGETVLTTETRVLCLDAESRKRFGLYWLLIGPFSGLTRVEILRSVKRKAQKGAGRTG